MTAILTGLRRVEVLALRAGDLELRGSAVYYHVRTKGGTRRHRELPAPAYAAITAVLALDVFTWKNAALMARRRLADDLPPAWSDPAQTDPRRRYRDA